MPGSLYAGERLSQSAKSSEADLAMAESTPSAADLAGRLAARLIHDLAGAAQGLAGALALLEEAADDALRTEAVALARQSAGSLERRLAFARAAWAGADIPAGAALEALSRVPFEGRRGSLTWVRHEEGAPGPLARGLLLLCQLVAAMLGREGSARAVLERGATGAWRACVEAIGPGIRPDMGALSALVGGGEGATSGVAVVAAYARLILSEAGGSMVVNAAGDRLTLEAVMAPAIQPPVAGEATLAGRA
jgi:hypothetical protein